MLTLRDIKGLNGEIYEMEIISTLHTEIWMLSM